MGHLWSILGLNISNFKLLSFPFAPEQAFSSLKITYFGALPLNCLKKNEKPGKIAIIRMNFRRNRAFIAEKTICLYGKKRFEICRNLTLKIRIYIKKFESFSLDNQKTLFSPSCAFFFLADLFPGLSHSILSSRKRNVFFVTKFYCKITIR